MSTPTIIFDYDMTLSPGESLVDTIAMAIDDHPDRANLRERFEDLRLRWDVGTRSLSDLVSALWIVRAIHKIHIERYVAMRRDLPDDLAQMFTELRHRGVRLHIVSSAYLDWLLPIGRAWGFAPEEIHARYRFAWSGGAAHTFNMPHLCQPPSKGRIVNRLVRAGLAGAPLIIVGDGRDDLEAFETTNADLLLLARYYASKPIEGIDPHHPRIRHIVQRADLVDAVFASLDGHVTPPLRRR
ncbi:HAD family hydrolase [Rhizobium daejeonense]